MLEGVQMFYLVVCGDIELLTYKLRSIGFVCDFGEDFLVWMDIDLDVNR